MAAHRTIPTLRRTGENKTAGTLRRPAAATGHREGRDKQAEHEERSGGKTAPYDIIMVDTCVIRHLPKPVKCTKVNLNLNHGLQMIVMCQCRFIGANTGTTLVGVPTGGEAGYAGIMCGRALNFPLSCAVTLILLSKTKSILKNFKHQQGSRKSVLKSRKYFQEPLHL